MIPYMLDKIFHDLHDCLNLTWSFHLCLQNMEEAGVDGALIVQPINHMFDHSLVTRCALGCVVCAH